MDSWSHFRIIAGARLLPPMADIVSVLDNKISDNRVMSKLSSIAGFRAMHSLSSGHIIGNPETSLAEPDRLLAAGTVVQRGAGFPQEVPGAHENAKRSEENTRECEDLSGSGEQRGEVLPEGRLPRFVDGGGLRGDGPDENCRQVEQRQNAQGAEPEESAAMKMTPSAAADFEPGMRWFGWLSGTHMCEIFKERGSDREGLCAGGAAFRMLPEVA